MLLTTVEVRWFLPGHVPAAVWRWFAEQGSGSAAQLPRTDYYLRIANSDTVGIKLREGRIEVKQRQAQLGAVRFGKSATGHVEQWCKWSFPLAEAESNMSELGDGLSSWIGVHKERKVRTFQVQDGAVVDVTGTMFLEQGCAWEVAQVRPEKTAVPWWSVGFEAFGTEAERLELLRTVGAYCLGIADAPLLALRDSYSYPRWMLNLEINDSEGRDSK